MFDFLHLKYTVSTVIIIIAIVCLLSTGVFLGYLLDTKVNLQDTPIRLNSSQYAFINPLLDSAENNASPLFADEIIALKNQLEDYTKHAVESAQIDYASIYYRDLNNGPWFTVGSDYTYTPASLLKIPLMMSFLKLSETDPDILTKKVTYEKEFVSTVEHHIISSNKTIELGKTYTILELIEYMVMYSDNLAAYLLIENIDPVLVGIVFTDLGVTLDGTTVDKKKLTPKEYASFFRVLYNGSYLNRDSSEKALEILSRSTFAFGMRSGLEEGAKASLKYGVTTSPITRKEFHECGIIYSVPTQPYILCIMTNGNNYQYMASYIKDVTAIINGAVKNNI